MDIQDLSNMLKPITKFKILYQEKRRKIMYTQPPVYYIHLHLHAVIQSSNHVAAVHCIESCKYRAIDSVISTSNIKIGGRGDLIGINLSMAVGAR